MKNSKNKKALSLMVEYVLLIVFSAVLAVIVYKVLVTYVPQNKIECPDGTSLLIENYTYNCGSGNQILTFGVENNGKFNISGYYIYVTDNVSKELPTINIAKNNTESPDPKLHDLGIEGIKLGMKGNPSLSLNNSFAPGESETETYDLTGINDKAYLLRIVPMRWQKEKGRFQVVSCADQTITKTLVCT